MSDWGARAWEVIARIHNSLPQDATFEQRRAALRDAYPFGQRELWPYKAWCKAQRQYLARYEPHKQTPRLPLTPLEKMMRRSA
jgi:hypothetical protein